MILCICIFVCISGAFASEIDDITDIADSSEVLYAGDCQLAEEIPENGSSSGNSFYDFNKLLEGLKPGDTLNIDNDYLFNPTADAENRIINININNIEINGNNHTINGGGENGAIFKITGSSVLIRNLCFTNFNVINTTEMTSAIQWLGDGGFCSDCYFYDNIGNDGGSLYWCGDLGVISQCRFENSTALNCGGAIFISGQNNVIDNVIFKDFSSALANEAIYCSKNGGAKSTLNIKEGTFENKGTSLGVTKFLYDNECEIMKNGVDIAKNSFIEIWDDLNNLKPGDYYLIEKDYEIVNVKGYTIWDRIINITADNVTIDGNGHTIDARGALNYLGESYYYGLFNVTGNNVKIVNLTLTGFRAMNLEYSLTAMNIYGNDYPRLTSPIEWHGDNGSILNCNFINNAGESGGAINWLGNNGIIENCSFNANSAGFGGFIYVRGVNNTIRNSKFKDAYTSNHYEAIYLAKGNDGNPSTLLVKNSTFASYYVGAKDVNVEDGCTVTFEEKHENDFPIVPFTELSYYLSILGDNSVYNFDQYYYLDAIDTAVITANNVTINGNGYKIYGDFSAYNAFTILGDNVTIINLTFELEEPYRLGSSIICWNGNNGILNNCSFIGNRADMGAALTWNGNNGKLVNCGFKGNAADVGGAVNWKGNDGLIDGCVFLNNTAKFAGALFISGINNTINNTLFLNAGASISNEAIYFDSNRKSLTLSNVAFSEGTVAFLDGHLINIAFDHVLESSAGYERIADEAIDLTPLIYTSILEGGVHYYKDDVSYYSTYYNETGDFIFTVIKEFPQYDVSYSKSFYFKNIFNNNFDDVYDALYTGNYENKFAISKTLYIDGKSALGDSEFFNVDEIREVITSRLKWDDYVIDYIEAITIANNQLDDAESALNTNIWNHQSSEEYAFGPVWDILKVDKSCSHLAEDYMTEVLNVVFTKKCTISLDESWDMSESTFDVINIYGNGSYIKGSYEDREEDKWAVVCPNKIFIASDLRIAGFNTAVENMGGQCIFTNVNFDHNRMDYWIDRDWGAAILNTGIVTCVNCSFTNNYAKNGGAIFNQGILILENCIFANNIAYGSGDHICVGVGGQVIIDGENITSNTNLVYFPKSMSLEDATLLSSILTGACFLLGVIAGVVSVFIPGSSAIAVVTISALVSAGIGAIGSAYIFANTYDVNYDRLSTALTLIIGCAAAGALGAFTGVCVGMGITDTMDPYSPYRISVGKVLGTLGVETALTSGIVGITYYFTHD